MGQLLIYSPLAALIAGGNWNNGANAGARAVNCNNYPWNVNTNIGARGACDLAEALQAQRFYGTLAREYERMLMFYSQSGCPAERQREKIKLLVSSCDERQELMKRKGYTKDQSGKRVTLIEGMADYGNIQKAYNKARKCKRYRKDVMIFTKDKEENLEAVRCDIKNLAYEPSAYRYFRVYEPKERQIMALPFYDRVVQHAINNVIEPIFDERFIEHSYACRKGKGMHAASDTLQSWLYEWQKFHPDEPLYAIKADVHSYFQSIDHAILKTEIRRAIKDAGALTLMDRIIDHNGDMPDGTGIPVGNLTSQLFANIYLNKLDQHVKHTLGAKLYIRYMDDFVILSSDIQQLRCWLADIERFLQDELKLELNPKTTILAAKNGIDFVGYKHRATHRKVRQDSVKRIKKTIKEYERGEITKEQLQKSIESWTGHASHADSYHLQQKIRALADAAIERVEMQHKAA